jgi:hypothetical protein
VRWAGRRREEEERGRAVRASRLQVRRIIEELRQLSVLRLKHHQLAQGKKGLTFR